MNVQIQNRLLVPAPPGWVFVPHFDITVKAGIAMLPSRGLALAFIKPPNKVKPVHRCQSGFRFRPNDSLP
jgi:hypothetical protein